MGETAEVGTRYMQALSTGDVDGAVALLADTCDFHTPMGPIPGKEMIRGYLGAFDSAFPGAQYELARVVEDGDTVAIEGVYRGTHNGALSMPDGNSLPATGRTVAAPFAVFLGVSGGAITSHRPYWDLAGFMAQLTG